MILRLFILGIVLALVVPVQAAEELSPRVGQRLLRILDRAPEDPERALEDLQEMIDARGLRESDRGFVMYERTAMLVQNERSEEALANLQEYLGERDEDYMPVLRFLLGQLLLIDNQPAEAITHFEIWSRYEPEPKARDLSLMGYALLQLERFEEAALVLERTIEIGVDADQVQWIELLAYCYTQLERSMKHLNC